MRNVLILLMVSTILPIVAQGNLNSEMEWNAKWITLGEGDNENAGMYLFRKTIDLKVVPETFEIHLSADNRYKLFVNEKLVSVGPNWGDIKHWNYKSVDLAPYLKSGENILAVKVWNEGELRAVAQFSWKTAFIMQGDDTIGGSSVNTDDSWKVLKDISYSPLKQKVNGYYAAGAGDFIDFREQSGNWKKLEYDDSSWNSAEAVFESEASGFGFRQSEGWNLVPSILPEMELKKERLVKVRRVKGINLPSSFPEKTTSITIPGNSEATILLDQTYLTNAYLSLLFGGGKNSIITISYAEALHDPDGIKGNRNNIAGKEIIGRKDSIISGGMSRQRFTTLEYRTYRYVELNVQTKDEPLVIKDIYGTYTGYPFKMKAKLESESEELAEILDIGWRTAKLCAVDTYMDCPYYERLQYVGDTRIQHFVSFYNSGDDRLVKNALNLLDYSRQPNGYTLSRYPDRQNQVIPPYSLWYVSMLYDYMMYGSDSDFVKEKLMGSRQVLNYFITYMGPSGSLKNVPGWNFTDWVPEWEFGVAPTSDKGSSALLDLQLLLALQSGIALENHLGKSEFVELYSAMADQLTQTIIEKYWDDSRQLFADTPNKNIFSQHANSLAILAGLVDESTKRAIGQSLLNDQSLAPASIYFKYYLHLALNDAGFGDQYLDWLDIWRKNIELGLTTWAETSQVESARSDAHAWGASPNIEFFRILLGIESASPNFKTVKIEPHLGELNKIGGEMPHPDGKISVNYDKSDGKLNATIYLPQGVLGKFIWNGKSHELKSGENKLRI